MAKNYKGEKSSKNTEYTNEVGRNNVLHSIELVKKKSPILRKMLEAYQIKIVGAYYEIKTGKVSFLE
jgi:carbonic anhydrase